MKLFSNEMDSLIYNHFRLCDLKQKIEKETNIEINSQLIIFNNLLFDSLVTEQQTIETYPIIDKEHPLVLFSLNNTMSSDDLAVIKQSKKFSFIRCVASF